MQNVTIRLIVCGTEQNKSLQGIHLKQPDMWYLNDAIDTAQKDGFETIFLHYKSKSSNYMIPAGILQKLLNLSFDPEIYFEVFFQDPRG